MISCQFVLKLKQMMVVACLGICFLNETYDGQCLVVNKKKIKTDDVW